jgi:FecR protein
MAGEESVAPETQGFSAAEIVAGTPRKPFYEDPLSLVGWGLALAAVLAYWYFFVRKPAPKPGQEVAEITALEGNVRLKLNTSEAWEEARRQARLHVGDVVQTDPGSGAEIQFDTGSLVRVRPDSVVYLGGSAESSTAAWRVQSGRVNFSVGDQATEIVTPTARTKAGQNAAGNIDVGEAGDTGVRIFAGQAEVETTQGQRITLAENEAIRVDAAGAAGSKLALPPAPQLVAPPPAAELPYVAPPDTTTTLAWKAVPRAETYHVAIDYNVVQANLLLSAALDQTDVRQTTHELRGLDPGRYFWRVAAVNKEGLEGAYSRVSLFAILPGATPPPPPPPELTPLPLSVATVEEVAGGIIHVHGRAAPGSTVTVDGHEVDVSPDGSFSEYLRGTDRGEVLVRATGPDGRSRELTRPVVVKR